MTNKGIMESINAAKEIINALLESENPVYTEECQVLDKTTVLKFTLAECIAYRTENAAYLLKNLLLNTRNTLPISTRIALAAVLETSSFVPNENALIPVYFKKTAELVPVYRWFSKNWGKFDVSLHFTEDPVYALDECEEPRTISLMTGKWEEA